MELIPGRVMIFGTFDIFHPGHRNFIEQAQREGKELIVVVARDSTVLRFKPSLKNFEQDRLKTLQKEFPALHILLGDEDDPMAVVKKFRPEIICLGYDQIGFSKEMAEAFPQIHIKRLQPYFPEKYKSSKM